MVRLDHEQQQQPHQPEQQAQFKGFLRLRAISGEICNVATCNGAAQRSHCAAYGQLAFPLCVVAAFFVVGDSYRLIKTFKVRSYYIRRARLISR